MAPRNGIEPRWVVLVVVFGGNPIGGARYARDAHLVGYTVPEFLREVAVRTQHEIAIRISDVAGHALLRLQHTVHIDLLRCPVVGTDHISPRARHRSHARKQGSVTGIAGAQFELVVVR